MLNDSYLLANSYFKGKNEKKKLTGFPYCIVTGHDSMSTAISYICDFKIMLGIWWDQLGIGNYEL